MEEKKINPGPEDVAPSLDSVIEDAEPNPADEPEDEEPETEPLVITPNSDSDGKDNYYEKVSPDPDEDPEKQKEGALEGKIQDDDEFELEFIKAPNNDLSGDWELDNYDYNDDDDDDDYDEDNEKSKELKPTESLMSIHISQMELTTLSEAREIAELIICTLEEDVAKYLEATGMEFEDMVPDEMGHEPRAKISGSTISISSDISDALPGEPSTIRMFYEKGKALRKTTPIQPLSKERRKDESIEVALHRSRNWHRVGGPPKANNVEVQTREMTFVSDAKAQLVFMTMYPKPDDYVEPVAPKRVASMELAIELAEKEDPNIDRSRKGPQIINFSNRKKLLQPLRDDYYKNESFWTGSNFKGEYKNRQFHKGHYDHPTGVKYESEWKDGHFHTTKHFGIMSYPRGDTFEGEWKNGRYTTGEITFGDGLAYKSENWGYCEPPDRRLRIEKYYGMKPAGNAIYNDQYPQPLIPPGAYDVGDGIYSQKTGDICGYDGFFIRHASAGEQKWIKEYCRKSPERGEEYIPSFNADRIPGSYMEQIQRFSIAKRRYH